MTIEFDSYGDRHEFEPVGGASAAKTPAWQPIETAPKDGSRILTYNVTPVYDEDARKTVNEYAVSVAYWLFGSWMEYPASPRYIQGQEHTHWMPLPDVPKTKTEPQ